ncbi:hypothetical protein OQH61_09140 [Helicobacter sp. MIT 21-1697]|uniref:hypothetical protein n=1 Tax=Helicobacter sp. MIT 21-1697 TaxID=2993733 RepID=UPI00224B5AAD|nr:hypothetical protein [Helicobacter sp. MIT 21-1697]MCX2717896.1 hypothetical protein [Helicobacter sp. MIT 21-1697]
MINTHNFPKIEGRYINLREAEVSDSAFILSLRIDKKKSQYIHKTQNSLHNQIAYMNRYKSLENEWYFIIEDKQGNALGTNSIYPTYNQFVLDSKLCFYEIGRWIMSDEASFLQVLESDLLTKQVFFETYKLDDKNVFTTNPKNMSVLNYHLKFGALKVGFDEKEGLEILLLTQQDYQKHKSKMTLLLHKE